MLCEVCEPFDFERCVCALSERGQVPVYPLLGSSILRSHRALDLDGSLVGPSICSRDAYRSRSKCLGLLVVAHVLLLEHASIVLNLHPVHESSSCV